MKKKKTKDRTDEIFGEIATGLSEAVGYLNGDAGRALFKAHIPDEIDVAAVRKKTGLTQERFANIYGFSPATIRDYEQKRRTPDSAVRAYLMVIDANGELVRGVVCPRGNTELANPRPHRRKAHVPENVAHKRALQRA
ncbi:MAG: helix-turn-helix domain-containing protein [Proteobacteria bacterium]|nr:helix-turn-helix domain-containing protein [Pseudomonadota bacterium]